MPLIVRMKGCSISSTVKHPTMQCSPLSDGRGKGICRQYVVKDTETISVHFYLVCPITYILLDLIVAQSSLYYMLQQSITCYLLYQPAYHTQYHKKTD